MHGIYLMTMTSLEKQVLVLLLSPDGARAEQLRRQLMGATVAKRSDTGAGFVTDLCVDSTLSLGPDVSFELSNVVGRHQQSPSGIIFTLFIRSGCLSWIEGASCDGVWPDGSDQIELSLVPREKEARLLR
jgi:hypothetical protein